MVIVFYCYKINLYDELADAIFSSTVMFFPMPPHEGEIIQVRSLGLPAIIRKIDHCHMLIEAVSVPTVEVVV
ncbi:hypothetical protein PN498_16165 [Oscillatoria sp. CS-180]|uniref:hypothetical protein n=1 Tax=Oscillatoria sp. CS-180 TaxID=3021720 RepID=UPI00232EF0F9|nr:hypothetical protein [Oscillatoria sp. CS-180]MDB9527534.1 hypothetical protein [Oscillatoria sp. CS-180]